MLGFVGRLSVEKNVALLAKVQQELERMGVTNFHFLFVGHGNEENWLRERLPRAEFTGVLRGGELSEAYANMDLFVFPSHTDTFGNVVLEALASGVPAIADQLGADEELLISRHSGRCEVKHRTRNLEIPGSREVRPGMTAFSLPSPDRRRVLDAAGAPELVQAARNFQLRSAPTLRS